MYKPEQGGKEFMSGYQGKSCQISLRIRLVVVHGVDANGVKFVINYQTYD